MDPVVVEVCEASGAIVVDGRIDEPAWAACPPVTDFLRYQPTAGGAPPGTTEVRLMQDAEGLYASIVVRDAGYPIRARIAPREVINADDQLGVYLDTFRTGRTGYVFYTNPRGVQQDIRATGTERWNFQWNTVWRAEGNFEGDRYVIEEFIPWRSLKYPAGEEVQTWGLVLTRKVPSMGYKYGFPSLTRNHPRFLSQGAELRGVRPVGRGSGLELVPGVTAAQTWPTEDGSYTALSPPLDVVHPSLDARYGITPDLGAAATIWPDFSQVESDAADIRLNARYANRYPETRPFFLDGVEHFQDPSGLLYTRSLQEPVEGLKLAGRTGATSTGLLHGLDLDPQPSVHVDPTPGFEDDDVAERLAASTMARAAVDAFGGGHVGVTVGDKRVLGAGTWDGATVDLNIPVADRTTATAWVHESIWGPSVGDQRWGQEVAASITRASGVGVGGNLTLGDMTPDLRKEMGFHTISALTWANGTIDHASSPGELDEWIPRLRGSVLVERSGEGSGRLTTGQQFTEGVTWIDVEAGAAWTREQGLGGRQGPVDPDLVVETMGPTASAMFQTEAGSALALQGSGFLTRTVDYTLLVPTLTASASMTAIVRPTPWLRVDTTPRAEVNVPDAGSVERAWALRTRIETQFSRTWGLRMIAEPIGGDGLDPAWNLSALLTWLQVPGTAFYAGYSEALVRPDGWETAERIAFAKATVLVRP